MGSTHSSPWVAWPIPSLFWSRTAQRQPQPPLASCQPSRAQSASSPRHCAGPLAFAAHLLPLASVPFLSPGSIACVSSPHQAPRPRAPEPVAVPAATCPLCAPFTCLRCRCLSTPCPVLSPAHANHHRAWSTPTLYSPPSGPRELPRASNGSPPFSTGYKSPKSSPRPPSLCPSPIGKCPQRNRPELVSSPLLAESPPSITDQVPRCLSPIVATKRISSTHRSHPPPRRPSSPSLSSSTHRPHRHSFGLPSARHLKPPCSSPTLRVRSLSP